MIGALLAHRSRFAVALAAVGCALVVAGCGKDEPPAKVRVATAFTPLQELAVQIGGNRVAATDLTPLGGQPHDLQPSPAALSALKRSKLVLYVGGGFQPAVADAVAKLGAGTAKLDVASDGTLSAPRRVRGVIGPAEGEGADRTAADPHVWLDPERFVAMAQQTQAALIAADPAHRAEFEARGGRYVAGLTQLAAEFQQQLTGCERKVILTTHPAWGYLAERHGLKQAVVGGIAPGATAPPQSLRALARYAERNDVTTLFTTVAFPSRQTRAIKQATGLTIQPLNPVEGLTQDERDRGAGYASIMRKNLGHLAAGLGCDGAPPSTTPDASTTPGASMTPSASTTPPTTPEQ